MIVRQTTLPDNSRSVNLIQTAMKLNAIKDADENSLTGVTVVENGSQAHKSAAISTRSRRSTVTSKIQKTVVEEVLLSKNAGLQAQPQVSSSSINSSRQAKQAAKKTRGKMIDFGDEEDPILAEKLAEPMGRVDKCKKNQPKTGISKERPSKTKGQSVAAVVSGKSALQILNQTKKAENQSFKAREPLGQTKFKRFRKGQQENELEVLPTHGINSFIKHAHSAQEGFSVSEHDKRALQPLCQQIIDKVKVDNTKIKKCAPPEHAAFQGGLSLKRDPYQIAVQRQSSQQLSSQEELWQHKKNGQKGGAVNQLCGPTCSEGSQNLNSEKTRPVRKSLDQKRVQRGIFGASKTGSQVPAISVCLFRNQVTLGQQRVSAPSSAALDGGNGELKLTNQESQRDEEELRRIADNAPRKLVYEQENEPDAVLQYTDIVYDSLEEETKKQPLMQLKNHEAEENDVYMTDSSHTVSENFDDACQDDQQYLNGQDSNQHKNGVVFEDSPELQRNSGATMEHRSTNRNVVSQKTPPQIYNNLFQSNARSEEFYLTTKAIIERRQMENPNIYKTGPTKYQDGANKGHWTPEEDAQLTKAVEKFKSKNWKKIAECLAGRTDVQCLHRWQKVLNPELVKGPWSKEEDKLVLSLVQARGAQKWTSIAEYLPGRIGKQCRERWHNHLNPRIKKNEWSLEEELILFIQNRKKENKWAEIAQTLEGRTDNTIKNHWNSSMKKKIFDMKCQTEKRFKKRCDELKIKYIGCYPEPGVTLSASYKKEFEQFEEKLLKQLIQTVKNQNTVYFREKARDLLTEKDPDGLNLQTAQLLIESLNMKLEDFLPQQSHSLKSLSASTAHGTTVQRGTEFSQKRQNDIRINPFTCQTTLSTKPTERDESAIGKGTSAFNIPTQTSNQSVKQVAENPQMQIMALQPSSSDQTRKNSTGRGRGRPRSNKNDIQHENFYSIKQAQPQSTKRQQQVQKKETQPVFPVHRSPKRQDLEHHQQNSQNQQKSQLANLQIVNEPYYAIPTNNSCINSATKQQSFIHGKNPMLPLSSMHHENHIFNVYDYENFNSFLAEDTPQIPHAVENNLFKSHHQLYPPPIQHQFSFGPPQMTMPGHQGGGNFLPSQLQLYQQNSNSSMLTANHNNFRFNGNGLISQGNQHSLHGQLHQAMMLDPSPNKAINEVVLDCHDLISQPMNKNGSLMFDHQKQQVSSPNSKDRLMETANSVRKQSKNNSDPSKGGETKIKITENPTVTGTSPEMFKALLCVEAKKNTPPSGQHMKTSNCLQLETPQQGDPSKKSKQSSAQNSISAFKPFGNNSSGSPMDLVAGNNDGAQHHNNIMISQFQGVLPPHHSMVHGHPQDDFMHPSLFNHRLSHFAGEEAHFGNYSGGPFMRYGQQHQPQLLQQHFKQLHPHQMNILIPTMVFNSVRRDSLLYEGMMGGSSFNNGNNISSLFQAVPRRQEPSLAHHKVLPNLSTTKLVQNKQSLSSTLLGKQAISLNPVPEDSQSSGQKTSEHVQQSFKPTIIIQKSPSMILTQNKYVSSIGHQQPQEKEKDVMMIEHSSPKKSDQAKRQHQVCKFIGSSCSKKSGASFGGSPKEQISPQQ